ncbi:lytic transglycosylase domain-containing protein [bacterium]|nr:lytic transglycosylase domain-containing protein [bacterium]
MLRKKLAFFSLFCTSFLVGQAMASPLYVIKGKRGVITFTTKAPKEGVKFDVFKPSVGSFSSYKGWAYSSPRSFKIAAKKSEYDDMISRTALAHALDPAFVKAVVHAESNFNPKAKSPKGAMGLMQLMPGTAKRFGVKNAYNPEANVKGGVQYLRFLLDRYDWNHKLAAAAYNAGEGAVDDYRRSIPPYPETQEYVRRVMALLTVYRSREKHV